MSQENKDKADATEARTQQTRSLSITIVIEAGRRQFKTLQNISKSSIIGCADRQDLGSYHLWPMNKDSMQDYWQHERFGVHY